MHGMNNIKSVPLLDRAVWQCFTGFWINIMLPTNPKKKTCQMQKPISPSRTHTHTHVTTAIYWVLIVN